MNNMTSIDEKLIVIRKQSKDKDYIVVKDHETAMDLIRNYKGEDLKGKTVIVAPDGLKFISLDVILRIPKVQKHIRRLLEEQEDLWNEKLQKHKEIIQRIGRDKDINSYASGYYEGGMEAIGYLTPDTDTLEVDSHL